MRLSVIIIAIINLICLAGYAGQNNWCEGGGVLGPVTSWGDSFYSDTDVNWSSNIGAVSLGYIDHTIEGNFDGAVSVYAQDVDGDGDMDVLGAAGYADAITWWENNDGSGTSWTEHTVDGNFGGARSVYAQDVDGDGDMDVLGAAWLDDAITWWENDDGSGTSWTEHTIEGNFDGAVSVYAEDIDGDGYMDVLGTGNNLERIIWWENDGSPWPSWTEHVVDWSFDAAASVCAQDVDGDGDMDVLGAGYYEITWWENDDGSGTSWTEHTCDGDFEGAVSVYAQDVSGDGHMDVLGAACIIDDITWWDVTNFAFEGSLESSILDAQESPEWENIDWICTEPENTSIAFQVRASDDPGSMGAWSDTLTSPGSLSGILTDGDSLFQYKVILSTSDTDSTPVLHTITIDWEPYVHIGESPENVQDYALHGADPNPAIGSVAVSFALPVNTKADLKVYDMSGRVVASFGNDYEAGVHQIYLNDLASGIYLVRMRANDFDATKSFVVIR